jgi:integrase/recombinase XerD
VRRFLTRIGGLDNVSTAAIAAFATAPGDSGRPPSASTVTVRLAAIRSFLDFLRRMTKDTENAGRFATNPADAVDRPKADKPTPRGLTVDDAKRLLAAIPDTRAGRRDRAIIVTALLTGLRRTEVLGLRRRDIAPNGNGRIYYTTRVKGGQERHRELPPPAHVAIAGYFESLGRSFESLDPDERLFDVGSSGFAMNFARYTRNAGLPGVSIHVLRHTAAKLRRDAGQSIEEVQQFLGHADLATTVRYLRRLEGEEDNGWQGVAQALGVAT